MHTMRAEQILLRRVFGCMCHVRGQTMPQLYYNLPCSTHHLPPHNDNYNCNHANRCDSRKMIASFADFTVLCNHVKEQSTDSDEQRQSSLQTTTLNTNTTHAEYKRVLHTLKIAHKATKAIDQLTTSWLSRIRGEDAISCIRHATTSFRITHSPLPKDAKHKCCCFGSAKTNLLTIVFTFTAEGEVRLSHAFVVSELWLRALQALLVLSRRRDYIRLAEQDADAGNDALRKELMLYFNNAFTFVQLMINTIS